ncbi:hypothetical protein PRIC2_005134 [Phytophthora ramorum]
MASSARQQSEISISSDANSPPASSSSPSAASEQVSVASSVFQALRSPFSVNGRRRRALPSPVSSESEAPRLSSYEVPLMDTVQTPLSQRQPSASSAGRTHGSRHSETNSELHQSQWHRRAAPSAVSAHSSRPSNSSMTQQQSGAPVSCNLDIAEMGETQCAAMGSSALPSCNYYVDGSGQLRIRKLWWCYMRMRRVLWCLFPWLKRDSNTYLCARMVANSTLIVVVYLVRELANHVVVPAILKHKDEGAGEDAEKHCHAHSLDFLDMYAYSLVANVLLCLPALNFKACRLYRRARRDYSTVSSTSSSSREPTAVVAPASTVADITKEQQRFEKTYLFTLCEIIVVLEIPFLIYTLVVIFVPSDSGSISEMFSACDRQLATGYFLMFLVVQAIAVFAYLLRPFTLRLCGTFIRHATLCLATRTCMGMLAAL